MLIEINCGTVAFLNRRINIILRMPIKRQCIILSRVNWSIAVLPCRRAAVRAPYGMHGGISGIFPCILVPDNAPGHCWWWAALIILINLILWPHSMGSCKMVCFYLEKAFCRFIHSFTSVVEVCGVVSFFPIYLISSVLYMLCVVMSMLRLILWLMQIN